MGESHGRYGRDGVLNALWLRCFALVLAVAAALNLGSTSVWFSVGLVMDGVVVAGRPAADQQGVTWLRRAHKCSRSVSISPIKAATTNSISSLSNSPAWSQFIDSRREDGIVWGSDLCVCALLLYGTIVRFQQMLLMNIAV